jgi:hypothetical protein
MRRTMCRKASVATVLLPREFTDMIGNRKR